MGESASITQWCALGSRLCFHRLDRLGHLACCTASLNHRSPVVLILLHHGLHSGQIPRRFLGRDSPAPCQSERWTPPTLVRNRSSDGRNTTTFAISSGVPNLPSGTMLASGSVVSSCRRNAEQSASHPSSSWDTSQPPEDS